MENPFERLIRPLTAKQVLRAVLSFALDAAGNVVCHRDEKEPGALEDLERKIINKVDLDETIGAELEEARADLLKARQTIKSQGAELKAIREKKEKNAAEKPLAPDLLTPAAETVVENQGGDTVGKAE